MYRTNRSLLITAVFGSLFFAFALVLSGCLIAETYEDTAEDIASETYELTCNGPSAYATTCYARSPASSTSNCYCDDHDYFCEVWWSLNCRAFGGVWTQNSLGKWGCLGMDNACAK